MKSKDQVQLEGAYQSVHHGGMPPTAGAAALAGATGGADFETAFMNAKIVFAKITEDLEDLEELDLDPKIRAILKRIDDRIETIVPTER